MFSARRCKPVSAEGETESADGLSAALSASSGSGTDVRGRGSGWARGPRRTVRLQLEHQPRSAASSDGRSARTAAGSQE